MKELRDIKIDILTGSQNPVIDLFNKITDGTEIINCDVYETHGLEFIYHKDGEWIFYQDCKNKNFWCSHTKYWSHFESNLQLEYGEIQAITKYLVEEALKREVITPPQWHKNLPQVVEEALKREVVRAQVGPQSVYPGGILEEALKREVSTPVIAPRINAAGLEETLKREVASPTRKMMKYSVQVEETLKRELTPDNENPVEP